MADKIKYIIIYIPKPQRYRTYKTLLFTGPQAKRAYSLTYTNTEAISVGNCGGCNSNYQYYGPQNFTCNGNSYIVYYNNPNYSLATNVCISINGALLSGNPPCCCMTQIW